jgi:hypothetical protein
VFVPAIVYLNLVSPHRPPNSGNPKAFHPVPFFPGHSSHDVGLEEGRGERAPAEVGQGERESEDKERKKEEGKGERQEGEWERR